MPKRRASPPELRVEEHTGEYANQLQPETIDQPCPLLWEFLPILGRQSPQTAILNFDKKATRVGMTLLHW